jgi:hypothetical protein
MMGRLRDSHGQRFRRDKCRDGTMPDRRTARELQPGDAATTDCERGYGVDGRLKTVTVTARREDCASQSGVMLRVTPTLKNNPPDEWFAAQWFAPVPTNVM